MDQPARWQDRFEIEQALLRYARGVDRKDWALVRSAYHPDAVDNHGAYTGNVDGFVEWLQKRHEGIEQSLHAISNVMIEFRSADAALVESYYICYQRPYAQQSGQTVQSVAVGRYIDRFERRDSRWAISHRKVAYDLLESHATPAGGGLNPAWILSRRDRSDVLYEES